MKYKYIVIGIADEFYEGDSKGLQFTTYDETLNYLKERKCDFLIDKLNYLESIKDSLCERNGVVSLVVSYA